jgi:Fur family ferric uptake transcriptional regulator
MATDGHRRDPAAELRGRRLRATPQRRAILAAFDGGAAEHLSAEEIHARASSRVAGLGRGTVYATLADLAEVGLLAAVGDQDPVRYELNTASHQHFRCRLCLRLFDVALRAPSTARIEQEGYLVEEVGVVVEGVCRDCQAYGQGLRDGAREMTDRPQVTADALSTLTCLRHETSLGTLLIGATADGIARVAFEGQADFDAFSDRARSRRGGRPGRDRCERLIGSIDAFLAGDHAQAADVFDWSAMPGAGRAVLEDTRTILWGERRSYHQLDGTDLSPYDRGFALGTNPMPLVFPCHRVTRGSEVASEYVAGAVVRRQLEGLEHPGH